MRISSASVAAQSDYKIPNKNIKSENIGQKSTSNNVPSAEQLKYAKERKEVQNTSGFIREATGVQLVDLMSGPEKSAGYSLKINRVSPDGVVNAYNS